MRLVRYGDSGAERPGLLDAAGMVRDLSAWCADISGSVLSRRALQALRETDVEAFPQLPEGVRLGAPVTGISKIVGVGLNYTDHAIEAGFEIPKEPPLFLKATSALNGPYDPILMPPRSTMLDWEVELGVVMGELARRVTEQEALQYVAGYVLANDVSERSHQFDHGGGHTKGKSADSFAPIGPWLLTADEVEDPQRLKLWLDVNGRRMQEGDTADMIFSVAALVSYVSQFMTLLPGDIIFTGTPAGVGFGLKPPVYLRAGDQLTFGITGLGEQSHQCVPSAHAG